MEMYHVLINVAAGESEIIIGHEGERLDHGNYTTYAVCETEEQAHNELKNYAGEKRYAVFYNRPANEGYVCEVDNLSGNYKGSGHHPYTWMGDHTIEEQAHNELKELKII